jgi:hypothetical protein
MVEYQLTEKAFSLYEELKKQPNWPIIQWLTQGESHPIGEHRKPPNSYFAAAALTGLVFTCDSEGFSSATAEAIAIENGSYTLKTIRRGLKMLIEDGLIFPVSVKGVDGHLIAWRGGRA